MKKFLLILLFAGSTVLFGKGKAIPLNISLFNESTGIPFTLFLTTPIHPGLQLGTDFNHRVKKHSRLFQTANIAYFYHKHLAQGISLSSELGYEYHLKFGLAITGLLGLGYMHTFATTEEFTFSNGQYQKKADKGNARLYSSFSVDIGYYLNKTNSPKLFLRYQPWLEYPYSPGFIPVMTHINLHIGITFFIHTKSKKND